MAEVIVASGKRKSSVARAYISKGKGDVRINSMRLHAYPEFFREIVMEPLELANKYRNKVNIRVRVEGGGVMSQAEAARTAIAKALAEFTKDEEVKQMFMEPKKQLGRGARKKRQKSYR